MTKGSWPTTVRGERRRKASLGAFCQSQPWILLFVATCDEFKKKKWATYNKEKYMSLLLNSKMSVVIYFHIYTQTLIVTI